jgi:hypothetical protein
MAHGLVSLLAVDGDSFFGVELFSYIVTSASPQSDL